MGPNHLKWLMVKVRENQMPARIKEVLRRKPLQIFRMKSMKNKAPDLQKRKDRVKKIRKRRMKRDKEMIVEMINMNKMIQENKMLMKVFEETN